MSKNDDAAAAVALEGFLTVVFALAVLSALVALVAWVVVLTAAAFGVTVPFWGTVGIVFLVSLVCRWLRGSRG